MKRGRRVCNQLKAVRRQIAEENGITLKQPECKHTGDCRGTCPRCEAEVRYLEQQLTQRLSLGKAATVAGLTLSLAACGGTEEKTLRTEVPLEPSTTVPADSGSTPVTAENDVYVEGISDSTTKNRDRGEDPPVVGPQDVQVILGEAESTSQLDSAATCEDELIEGEPTIYSFVEEEASFPGGEKSLYDFFDSHIQYPDQAKKEGISGTVVVKFIVEKDGSITNVRCVHDIGGGCGAEAVRVVKGMPKWKPGKQNGRPVRSDFALPVNFEIK